MTDAQRYIEKYRAKLESEFVAGEHFVPDHELLFTEAEIDWLQSIFDCFPITAGPVPRSLHDFLLFAAQEGLDSWSSLGYLNAPDVNRVPPSSAPHSANARDVDVEDAEWQEILNLANRRRLSPGQFLRGAVRRSLEAEIEDDLRIREGFGEQV